MYNELLAIVKACFEFWKGFFASENKAEYIRGKNALKPILMLVGSILILIIIVCLGIKILGGSSDVSTVLNKMMPIITDKNQTAPGDNKTTSGNADKSQTVSVGSNAAPIVTEKTQTIPVDGKNIVCNIKVELIVPKN